MEILGLGTIDLILVGTAIVGTLYVLGGIRIVRPTEMATIERMGKFKRVATQGFTWIAPGFESVHRVNITEQIADPEPQQVITKNNLNCMVDMHVYFKVRPDVTNVKKALYNVRNYRRQIVALARTTMRNVIGSKDFVEVNSSRDRLNDELRKVMDKETDAWGIEVVRCELKEIEPPEDVQETMNNVIKSKNEKTAAVDYATAEETKADGTKRASIKEAEGNKQSKILVAEGQAKSIELVNRAARKYFVGNAQKLKQLEVTQASLEKNSKVILTEKGIKPVVVLGDKVKTK